MALTTVPALSSARDSAEEVSQATVVVLDTSVLVSDPDAISCFGDCDIVLPLTVINELDGLKVRKDEVGWAARAALRAIEELRLSAGGDIRNPVAMATGGTLRVEPNGLKLDAIRAKGLDPAVADNRILAACVGLRDDEGRTVKLVSGDTGLRIKASQLDLVAEDYRSHRDDLAAGVGWQTVDDAEKWMIDELYSTKHIPASALALGENEGAVLKCGSQSVLVRRSGDRVNTVADPGAVWDLQPRSAEQRFALDLLLDPDVPVVALEGPAGCGKTILALAAALHQVVEERRYDFVGIYRPPVAVGHADLGFLPGSLEEKLDAWTEAVDDNLIALAHGDRAAARNTREQLVANNQLAFGSIAHIRGRSIANGFVLVDEAQNLEPSTLRTLLTRVADGTKMVFTGDTSQIDAPFLSRSNNGLSTLTAAFAGQRCFGHVTLTRSERSGVAALAAELL